MIHHQWHTISDTLSVTAEHHTQLAMRDIITFVRGRCNVSVTGCCASASDEVSPTNIEPAVSLFWLPPSYRECTYNKQKTCNHNILHVFFITFLFLLLPRTPAVVAAGVVVDYVVVGFVDDNLLVQVTHMDYCLLLLLHCAGEDWQLDCCCWESVQHEPATKQITMNTQIHKKVPNITLITYINL